MSTPSSDVPFRYEILISDQAVAERDRAYLRLVQVVGPEYAHRWLAALLLAINTIAEPLGPRAHAIEEHATERYGVEVRRLLYYGPGSRRSRTSYRILFFIIDPEPGSAESGVIRVLRILHGAQELDSSKSGSD